MNNIKEIIKKKHTKICLAADVDNSRDLFKLIEITGDKICILKIHYDIISDFFSNKNVIEKLIEYKEKYNFLIWEDSKFGDIGYILEKKINNHIVKWADLISITPIGGELSIKNITNIGIILIGEMSCEGHLLNNDFQEKVIALSKISKNIVGIVCQHKMSDTLLNITPGISISKNKDDKGQKYSSVEDKNFSDIFVIGRAIYQSENPRNTLLDLLKKI